MRELPELKMWGPRELKMLELPELKMWGPLKLRVRVWE
jgi:hypothetical protein